jgi:prepilin signal peptidase PulO-like enzyme (type II secretory pathway)
VAIYRLARGMSIRRPARSFCPACGSTIAWYDNIPILSFLALGGRCRRCGTIISLQYPLVEGITVLLFVLMYDTFFLGPARPEFRSLGTDWPVFVAHLVLVAALVVTSAIDMEGYWIDVNITYAVAAVGVIAHGLWTPATSAAFPRPGATTSAAAVGPAVGLVVAAALGHLLRPRPRHPQPEQEADPCESQDKPSPKRKSKRNPRLAMAWLVLAVVVVWIALAVIDADRMKDPLAFGLRAGLVLLTCFAIMVGAGMPTTQAEMQIVKAIDEERSTARPTAFAELVWLLPAIFLGILAALVVSRTAQGGVLWHRDLSWAPLGGSWRPVLGVSSALGGFVVAGAVGWGVRIVFTMLLGKEAFGMGDVHLMAAAGAVAGWPVVVAGFFLACPLALAAVLIWLIRKRSRAVWFGPWLSLGVVVAMVLYRPIAGRARETLQVLAWLLGRGGP